jgi:hypothetical protein
MASYYCSAARRVLATRIEMLSAGAVRIAYQIRVAAVFWFTGRLNVKVAPITSGLFSAHILPPCASTILFDMNNPNPVPPVSDFVVNFVNSLGNISRSIPVPVSLY